MKRLLLLSMMFGVALWGAATDRFYIEDFSISPGETRTVSILLDNEAEYTAFQCDVCLPEGLTASNFALTNRKASNHTFSTSVLGEGSAYRLLSYSLNLKPYSGNSGALVTFDITAGEDFVESATINLRNVEFTTTEGAEIPFSNEQCTVTYVAASKKGDVNNDGKVTISDVTALIDYLLGGDESQINLGNADVNDSQGITIADVTALIDLLLSNGA